MAEPRISTFWQCPRCGYYTWGPTVRGRVTGEEVCFSCSVRENLAALGLCTEDQDRVLRAMLQAGMHTPRAIREM